MCERERVIDSGRETRRYGRRWHWTGTWHIRQRNSSSCKSVGCIQTLRPLLEREQWTFQSEEEGQLSINEIMYQAGHLMLYAMFRPPGSIYSLQPPWRCQVLGKAVNLGCCPSLGCDPLSRGVPPFLPRSWPFVSAPPPTRGPWLHVFKRVMCFQKMATKAYNHIHSLIHSLILYIKNIY